MVAHAELTLAINKEVCGLALLKWEDVVVEIYILFVEILDAVKVQLNGVAVERGEKLRRNNIAVQHHVNLVPIQPLGHLALVRNYEVYLADEGHILGYTSKEVTQCAPIAKTLLQHGLVGEFFVVALPHRIQAVYICYYYIHPLNL